MRHEDAADPLAAPSFCPACRRDGPAGAALCPTCGEALRPQGFCPTCESWVRSSPGEPCPKHDLELQEFPEPVAPSSSRRLVTIASFGLPLESYGPKLRLEAEGIPVFLQGERMGQNAIYQVATGGVKLQVPEEFVADARVLLAQSWSPVKPEEDEDWAGLEPDAGENRRSVMKLMILVYLFAPLGVGLILFLIAVIARG